jgi:hypothetical protein
MMMKKVKMTETFEYFDLRITVDLCGVVSRVIPLLSN